MRTGGSINLRLGYELGSGSLRNGSRRHPDGVSQPYELNSSYLFSPILESLPPTPRLLSLRLMSNSQ